MIEWISCEHGHESCELILVNNPLLSNKRKISEEYSKYSNNNKQVQKVNKKLLCIHSKILKLLYHDVSMIFLNKARTTDNPNGSKYFASSGRRLCSWKHQHRAQHARAVKNTRYHCEGHGLMKYARWDQSIHFQKFVLS